jgi:dipeptidyl aminopeptidase/acylaminoacyl peptidase
MQADHDALFVPLDDTALFSGAPSVEFVLLRNTGHEGFSHPTSARAAVRTVSNWLGRHF